MMSDKVLLVDDEPNVLEGYKRQLRGRVDIHTAIGGLEGLKAIESRGPYAVVISDFMMPVMDGVTFLAQVKEKAPETVRVMLTGHAHLQLATDAVNQGQIFRFLSKPCSADTLLLTIKAGLEQYRLVTAEKELLEKTLSGSIKVLTEVLSLANPTAFSRASRIKQYVGYIAKQLDLPYVWEFELAATFSLLGCITLPPAVLEKVYRGDPLDKAEHKMYSEHPKVGSDLIKNIPRLENIAAIIMAQREPFKRSKPGSSLKDEDRIALGGYILKAAVDFDQLLARNMPTAALLKRLQSVIGQDVLEVFEVLKDLESRIERKVAKKVRIEDMDRQMVLDQDVCATDGLLLVSKGQEVTFPVLARLRNYADGIGVVQPIKVVIYTGTGVRKSRG